MFLRVLKGDSDSATTAISDGAEPEQRMVWAEVYAPDRPDAHNEFMDRETIRKMAHDFMRSGKLDQIDMCHDNKVVKGCHVVESFIARDDDPVFIPGSWVAGVHIPDDDTWEKVKKGELNGFSIEAFVEMEEVEVEMEIDPVVTGKTSIHKDDDHEHTFSVAYGDDGKFLGGKTNVVNGHYHVIKAGTVTEVADGHRHKFSSVDDGITIKEIVNG